MAATPWGYAETYSILVRRANAGAISAALFAMATSALQSEVADNQDFRLFAVDDGLIFASIAAIRDHNLNATDAALLTLPLDYVRAFPEERNRTVLIASDQRLLRAAAAEGLHTLNPETSSPDETAAFLLSILRP